MNMKIMVGLMAFFSVIALCVVLNVASGVFIPLVIAWFILQIFSPIIQMSRKFSLPPLLNITLVFTLLFCVTLIGIHFVASQVTDLSHVYLVYAPKLNETLTHVMQTLRIPQDVLTNFNWLDLLGRYMRNISEAAIALSSKLVLTLVFLMFMLLEAPYLNEKIDKAFLGPSATRIKNILNTISTQISRYLGTLTLISVVTGICAWFILTAVGVELATGWAVLTILLNFIPTVGSIIATLPPVVMALIQFSPNFSEPLIVLAALTATQLTIGNVITPKVMGDRLGLSPIMILFSLLMWGVIWGIPGAILSTPIASIMKIICENTRSLRPIAVIMGSGEAALKIPLPQEAKRPGRHTEEDAATKELAEATESAAAQQEQK